MVVWMKSLRDMLTGGDRRSLGRADQLVNENWTQQKFDELFSLLSDDDRVIAMRGADLIEKITVKNPVLLKKHKKEILLQVGMVKNIELKWHLPLLVSRISLTEREFANAWNIFTNWAIDKKESRIVRVNSIQCLFEFLKKEPELLQDFLTTISEIRREEIPSLNARIRKIKGQIIKEFGA